MALTRSDISASVEELDRFSAELERLNMGALWAGLDPATMAKPQAVAHVLRSLDLLRQEPLPGEWG
jgi:hypothetical protein